VAKRPVCNVPFVNRWISTILSSALRTASSPHGPSISFATFLNNNKQKRKTALSSSQDLSGLESYLLKDPFPKKL
jgi:hypothetical protein